jgi:PilZ domain
MHPTFERRKYERLPLRLPFQFSREGGSQVIDSFTENISSEGLFFVSLMLLKPGETLEINVPLPAHASLKRNYRVYLRCRGQVLRVESDSGAGFGIACRLEKTMIRFTDAAFEDDPVFRRSKS